MAPSTVSGSAAPLAALPHPTIELGELLHQYQLELVLIAGASDAAVQRPVQWVHVSELENPSQFLPPRTVLLTTGARFEAMRSQAEADAYVRRLVDAGVTALGVAVGLHFDRVPAPFVSACDRLELPLFRVPYDTAFIEIVRTAARLLEAGARERDLWALESQRSVTAASLHRDGLSAVIREAAARLGRWVCITDRTGRIVEIAPRSARSEVRAELVRRETRRLIERGASAGRIGDDSAGGIQLQALGRQGRVLGVLVVEDHGAPDAAERALLGLVGALSTMHLEHRSGIDSAQASLRQAIVQLLLARHFPLAEKLASGAAIGLPQGSLVAVRYRAPEGVDPEYLDDLQSLDAASPGMLHATLDGAPLILGETRHLPAIRRILLTRSVPAGVSERGAMRGIPDLLGQADRALDYAIASGANAPVDYHPSLHDGVLHLLGTVPDARQRAAGLLAPLRQHDRRHGDTIERSLFTWLAHHGQTSPAAAELEVHRHTLKSRVQTAAQLLQVDIDSPDTRAELWAALRLLETAE